MIPWDDLDLGNIVDEVSGNLKRQIDDIKDNLGDLEDDVKDNLGDLEDDIKNKTNNITNEVAEQLADRLGISDWYSIHIMSACHGNWEPNATDSSPSLNVTDCSNTTPTCKSLRTAHR